MLKLSAQVDHDRIKEGVPANVYLSYLKACGIMVVIVTLSISVLAQVSTLVGGGGRFSSRQTCSLHHS